MHEFMVWWEEFIVVVKETLGTEFPGITPHCLVMVDTPEVWENLKKK